MWVRSSATAAYPHQDKSNKPKNMGLFSALFCTLA
jgi:hypothetical protein